MDGKRLVLLLLFVVSVVSFGYSVFVSSMIRSEFDGINEFVRSFNSSSVVLNSSVMLKAVEYNVSFNNVCFGREVAVFRRGKALWFSVDMNYYVPKGGGFYEVNVECFKISGSDKLVYGLSTMLVSSLLFVLLLMSSV